MLGKGECDREVNIICVELDYLSLYKSYFCFSDSKSELCEWEHDRVGISTLIPVC